ncbi:hypothetical protein, partial [Achromobacter xylosoxidans]|uniref:hypothetical protein n=1 Tax=Alcaligenes xylosoxydans xylosoxydans TaxID=85698 RepID=UPI001F135B9D
FRRVKIENNVSVILNIFRSQPRKTNSVPSATRKYASRQLLPPETTETYLHKKTRPCLNETRA